MSDANVWQPVISKEQLDAMRPPPVLPVPKLSLSLAKPKIAPKKDFVAPSTEDGKKILQANGRTIEYELVNGKKQGYLLIKDKSGQDYARFHYVDDMLQGISEFYYPNGNVWRAVEFTDGEMDGLTTVFYQTSDKWMELPFKKGKMHGMVNFYDRNGDLSSESEYRDGVMEGIQIVYVNGKKHESYFLQGEKVEKKEYQQNDY